jgi:hypothetical protein
LLLLLALGAARLGAAQVADFVPSRCLSDTTALPAVPRETLDSVAAGVTYRCQFDPAGPWVVHTVAVSLTSGTYLVDGVRAHDAREGRERVSDMMQRLRRRGAQPLVAMNADFFNLQTGAALNNTVIAGTWVQGTAAARARTQFGMDVDGRPLVGRFSLAGSVAAGSASASLRAINTRPPGDTGLVLYTPWHGERTPGDSSPRRLELRLRRLTSEPGAWVLVADGVPLPDARESPIPGDGAVLAAYGEAAAAVLARLAAHDTLRIRARLADYPVAPFMVVGGWGRLVQDGRNVAALTDAHEGSRSGFSAARHPRSAVGVTRDSSALLLVVVDGRRPWSVGMSLEELAQRLLSFGAVQGANLDGGGSSTLWVGGTVVNYPSDTAGERPVANAVVVLRRR